MGNRNMMSAVFSQVRKKYKEVKNDWSRKRPGPHRGVSEHNLEGYQVYPYGDNFFSCMIPAVEMEFKDLAVDLETPVASLGSCFAEEFAYHMLSKGFNYIRTEKNRGSSANWGRVCCKGWFRGSQMGIKAVQWPVIVDVPCDLLGIVAEMFIRSLAGLRLNVHIIIAHGVASVLCPTTMIAGWVRKVSALVWQGRAVFLL